MLDLSGQLHGVDVDIAVYGVEGGGGYGEGGGGGGLASRKRADVPIGVLFCRRCCFGDSGHLQWPPQWQFTL